MFSEKVKEFNSGLSFDYKLPSDVEVMNPFDNESTAIYSDLFYDKYYSDSEQRIGIFGINPGRFGAGVTGVPFTDPIKLSEICNIENPFHKRKEPSSDFVYDVIAQWGSVSGFYKNFFISSLCPLGFTKGGNNYNYYDSKDLLEVGKKYIIERMREQLAFGLNTKVAYCLGKGTNYKIFVQLNKEHSWFDTILPLPHPRWVIQYNRKKYQFYIDFFNAELSKSLDKK